LFRFSSHIWEVARMKAVQQFLKEGDHAVGRNASGFSSKHSDLSECG
jgi:hypothetical protein